MTPQSYLRVKACRITVVSLIATIAFVFLWGGCASGPRKRPMTVLEQIQQDNTIGPGLSERLDPSLRFKTDLEVAVYLKRLGRKLASSFADLKNTPLAVLVISDRDSVWRSFAIPGIRAYVSAGILAHIEYENELAAVLAFELGHILRRQLVTRLKRESWDPALGFFPKFDVSEDLEALDDAMEILYQAGFDQRGMISLWEIYERNIKSSPFSKEELLKLKEATRRMMVEYVPLRDPIVRTDDFILVQKRFRKL